MELADKPCYPSEIVDYNLGLTFRERLIVALANNPIFYMEDGSTIRRITPNMYEVASKDIINQADAIIKQLEEEKK